MRQKIIPRQLDIANLRKFRQKNNLENCLNGILTKKISKTVNAIAWKKTLNLLNFTEEEIFHKSENDLVFAKLLASTVCKNASRQCGLDEELQIQTCNEITSLFGVFLEKININDCVPLKSGQLVSRSFVRDNKVSKNECLKSFDAKISGKLSGFVFAKIVIGRGGHQDNVFEEAYSICEWAIQFGSNNKFYIVLIDTDCKEKLKKLRENFLADNLLIGDSVDIQNYFIQKN